MLNKIGYLKSIKFDELVAHLLSCPDRYKKYWAQKTADSGCAKGESDDCLMKIHSENMHYDNRRGNGSWRCRFGEFGELLIKYNSSMDKSDYANWLPKKVQSIKNAIDHYESLGGRLEVVVETGRFYVVKYSANLFAALPKEFAEIELPTNYDGLSSGEIQLMLSGSAVPAEVSNNHLAVSPKVSDLREQHLAMQEELTKMEAEAKKQYEIAKKEMEDKLRAFKERQELAMADMLKAVEVLKDNIFVLEINIFALRTLFGETFTLTQLRSGKSSKNPLVLYQKFKFLDEEFALLAIKEFGNFNGKHGTTTEIFKKENVQAVFLPSDKCVTFFRTSKDRKYYTYDSEFDGLTALEYYHENQIGMLIRNGENVWLSFIDEEVFVEDNLFESDSTWVEMSQKIKPDWKGEYDYKKDVFEQGKTKLRDPVVKKAVDKIMLFQVLTGLAHSTNIFPELKGIDLRKPSDKVIFSSADNQLTTSKYPDFKTYFTSWRDKDQEDDIRLGDTILIVERGAASECTSDGSYRGREEHRSRGFQNRARDAEDIKCGLNNISFIEKGGDRWFELMVDKKPYRTAEENNGEVVYYRQSISTREARAKDFKNCVNDPEYEFYISSKRHVDDYWRRDEYGNLPSRVNNVNLLVYNEDFCPVDFINSNYVMSWLEQKNIGDWYKGNYVYLVENIFHDLLKMLRGREDMENGYVRMHLPEFSGTGDDLDAVTEWKKLNKVRVLNEFQAKRFSKWYIAKRTK